MSDVTTHSIGPLDDSLVLLIENREPLYLRVVAEAFQALANDFRKATGQELVIQEVHQGSLIAIFKKASEWAGKTNDLVDFGLHLSTVLAFLLVPSSLADRPPDAAKPPDGLKSVVALATVATSSSAKVHISYRSPQGEEFLVSISPAQGHMVQQNAAAIRKRPPAVAKRPPTKHNSVLEDEIAGLARAITDQRKKDPTAALSSNPAWVMLKPIIAAICERADGKEILARIAKRLRSEGQHEAAKHFEAFF